MQFRLRGYSASAHGVALHAASIVHASMVWHFMQFQADSQTGVFKQSVRLEPKFKCQTKLFILVFKNKTEPNQLNILTD